MRKYSSNSATATELRKYTSRNNAANDQFKQWCSIHTNSLP